jgi:DNA (cytosine-5)-methyltransferase 1
LTFSVVSTFSGCGGSSLGYQLAGGKVLLAVEWDQNSVDTYRLNFPTTDIYHGDICALSVNDVLDRTGLQPGDLDIFDGSPPCQGFSTAGKREFHDQRNQLFREYVRLLRGLRPKVFVMENVSGMAKGKMKLIFAECLHELRASGYKVKARLLNAKFFNVPQSRERMIFIGVRDDLGNEPSHPKPIKRAPTVREALRDCPFEYPHPGLSLGKIPELMKQCQQGKSLAQSLKMTSYFSWTRAHWDKPCMTICRPTLQGCGIFHPDEHRCLSGRELARLASFPDSFRFVGSYRDVVTRIGNCVCPLFMKAIATHIKTTII